MSDYTVHAKRAGKYWELHIDGVGVTQSRGLGVDAEEMIRSCIATVTGRPADDAAYTVVSEAGPQEEHRRRVAAAAHRCARVSAGLFRRLAGK